LVVEVVDVCLEAAYADEGGWVLDGVLGGAAGKPRGFEVKVVVIEGRRVVAKSGGLIGGTGTTGTGREEVVGGEVVGGAVVVVGGGEGVGKTWREVSEERGWEIRRIV
jgi:hypothetical protein